MLVRFYALDGTLLLERPQDAIPPPGTPVPVEDADGTSRQYRVHRWAWPLRRPTVGHTYYSLTDAPDCLVQIWLEED